MARKKDTKKVIRTETSIKKENIEIMSLDNKPINKEVIKEPVNVPDKFVKMPKRIEHTKTINIRNGRVYKELGNGYGVYSDDGSVFKIEEDYMEFIKINNNRYMIKNSNNIIVSEEEKLKLEKRELVIKDIKSNECQGKVTQKIQEIDRKLENEHKTIKKARKSIK